MTIIGGGMGIVTKLPWPVWLGASPLILDPLAKVLPDIYSYTTAGMLRLNARASTATPSSTDPPVMAAPSLGKGTRIDANNG